MGKVTTARRDRLETEQQPPHPLTSQIHYMMGDLPQPILTRSRILRYMSLLAMGNAALQEGPVQTRKGSRGKKVTYQSLTMSSFYDFLP